MAERRPILLLDGATREPVEATLVYDVTEEQLRAADALWVPASEETIQEAFRRGISEEALPEHRHWRWQRKMRAATAASRFLSIECGGETQGLMAVRTDKVCRLAVQAGLPLIYVDYLATAPWNQGALLQQIGRTPHYRRIGEAMMQAAVDLSRGQGYGGRIGLHALPQADAFYVKCGMSGLGIDTAYESLGYFEMTPEQADRLRDR